MTTVMGRLVYEKYVWKRGDPLPVSPIDGYQYSLDELVSCIDGRATFARKAKED